MQGAQLVVGDGLAHRTKAAAVGGLVVLAAAHGCAYLRTVLREKHRLHAVHEIRARGKVRMAHLAVFPRVAVAAKAAVAVGVGLPALRAPRARPRHAVHGPIRALAARAVHA
jgi:hypothetical protein